MPVEGEKWSSVEEVAEHLQVHKDTIRLWIKKGEIPARKVGRLWRFKISEIDEWVQSGKSSDINKGGK
jgi:excisionase family DNA binding protein